MSGNEHGRTPARIEANFGAERAFALGVEEELLVVDDNCDLVAETETEVESVSPPRGEVAGELFGSMVESQSPVSANAAEAIGSLRDIRRSFVDRGIRLMGVGVHPTAPSGTATIQQSGRYGAIGESLQGVLRTPLCGQHIHVGLPDERTAVRAYNGIRLHVPLLNALAANSPFWFGEDSGLASSRTVLFRSYPRAAMAPQLDDFAHFERIVDEITRVGSLADYTHIWWDVRLHPTLGTIEIRAADTQTDLGRAAALVALVHCLVRLEAEGERRILPSREALAESSFQATRYGLDANLLDPRGDVVPARELGRRTLAAAATVAGELSCEPQLGGVERILEQGCGADRQREVHAGHGMKDLLRWLVDETGAAD